METERSSDRQLEKMRRSEKEKKKRRIGTMYDGDEPLNDDVLSEVEGAKRESLASPS